MRNLRLKCYTLGWVALFSYLGVLTRAALKLLAQTSAGGQTLPQMGPGFFLPNIVGTFMLGVAAGLGNPIPQALTPIRVGFHVGFCGSCTTFATWQLVTGVETLNGKWWDGLIITLNTYCTSFLALCAGRQLGKVIQHWSELQSEWISKRKEKNAEQEDDAEVEPGRLSPVAEEPKSLALMSTSVSRSSTRTSIAPATNYRPDSKLLWFQWLLFLSLTLALYVGVALDQSSYRHWWIAISFAPVGAITRYLLSVYNDRFPKFPIMTFACNIAASSVDIVLVVLYNSVTPSMSTNAQSHFRLIVLSGLVTGCMGSLSTVSTMINEIWKLSNTNTWHAYRYALGSLLAAQSVVLAIGAIYMSTGNDLLYK